MPTNMDCQFHDVVWKYCERVLFGFMACIVPLYSLLQGPYDLYGIRLVKSDIASAEVFQIYTDFV